MGNTLLVTGASGQLGRGVITHLLETQHVSADRIVAATRDPQKVADFTARGVDVRRADFDEPSSLESVFAGVERALIVSTAGDNETRIRQHLAAVEAARRAGVPFLAYTSLAKADQSPLSLGEVHRATEAAIRATGIAFVFLRNNWYIENETGFIQGVLAGAPLPTSAGAGRVGWAARDDYAAAAAAVLAGEGHENAIYELSGPPRTYDELGSVLSEVLGREVSVQHMKDSEFERVLVNAGLPSGLVAFVREVQVGIRAGALDVQSDNLQNLLGRPVTPLRDAVAGIVAALSASGAPEPGS